MVEKSMIIGKMSQMVADKEKPCYGLTGADKYALDEFGEIEK
jgi:hypothetical protein